ncbi:hypothetical protein D3C87_1750520 [compost metagenome]
MQRFPQGVNGYIGNGGVQQRGQRTDEENDGHPHQIRIQFFGGRLESRGLQWFVHKNALLFGI